MPRWEKIEIEKEKLLECFKQNHCLIAPTAKQLGVGRYLLKVLLEQHSIPIPTPKTGFSKRDVVNKYIGEPFYKKAKRTYDGMMKRCYNEKEKCYPYYGGRGISVQKEWKDSIDNFIDDCLTKENAFCTDYSIDRIDVNGDYCVSNVRFVTHKENCNNRRNNRYIEYNGRTLTLAQWGEEYGVSGDFLKDRLRLGFSFHEAVTIPKGVKRSVYYKSIDTRRECV